VFMAGSFGLPQHGDCGFDLGQILALDYRFLRCKSRVLSIIIVDVKMDAITVFNPVLINMLGYSREVLARLQFRHKLSKHGDE